MLAVLLAAVTDARLTTDLRTAVAKALGDRGDRRAVTGLRTVLARPGHDGAARRLAVAAATALGKLGDDSGLPLVRQALTDEWSVVRRAAYLAVEVLRAADTQVWAKALRDAAADVRCAAVDGLLRIGTPEAVDLLIPLTEDTDPDVAEYCAQVMGGASAW